MKTKALTFAAMFVAGVIASPVSAGVVYNGGTPNQNGGYYADQGYSYSETGAHFMLDSATQVNGIRWWGAYDNNQAQTDNFFLKFYAGGEAPGALLFSFNLGGGNKTATGNMNMNWAQYVYQANFSSINFAANTSYFVSLSNQNTGSDSWFWENGTGASYDGFSYSSFWEATGATLAFELTNDARQVVSVPATLSLFALSLLLLNLRRRA